MRTVIKFAIFFLFSNIALAQSSLKREIEVIREASIAEKLCNQSQTRREQSQCKSDNMNRASSKSTIPIMSAHFKTAGFLYAQAALIDELGDARKISDQVRNQKYNEIIRTIDVEWDYAFNRLDAQWAEQDARAAEIRSNRVINNSLSFLGSALSSSDNKFTNQTYVINGKMITCTTTGTFTNCF
jgi:hypothetical protein